MRHNIHFRLVLILIIAGTFILCTKNNDIAGGTNLPNQVAGVIYLPDGNRADGIQVSLIRDNDTVIKIKTVHVTTTDDSGHFCFSDIDTGRYMVECITPDSGSVFLQSNLQVEDTTLLNLNDTMRISGTIVTKTLSTLPRDLPGFVWIENTPYLKEFTGNDTIIFKCLPPGEHTLIFTSVNYVLSTGSALACSSLVVPSGGTVTIDTLSTFTPEPQNGSVIIDDFNANLARHYLGQGWWIFNDSKDGGLSIVEPYKTLVGFLTEPGSGDSGQCAHIKFTFGSNGGPYHVGCGFYFRTSKGIINSADISAARQLHLKLKGFGTNVQVGLFSHLLPYRLRFSIDTLDTTWTDYSVDLDSVALTGGLEEAHGITWSELGKYINEIIILATSPEPDISGELWIDDMELEY